MVALAGGSTPSRLYALLGEPPHRAEIPWARVELFWGDERCVPPDHADSNYRGVWGSLLRKVDVSPEHVHRMLGEHPDRTEAAREYAREMARAFGLPAEGTPPVFDLVLLGMGADGHMASLFPWSAALTEARRWVMRHAMPMADAERLTLTVPVLNRAREMRVLVAGMDKAGTLAAVLEGPRDPERLPAQLLRPGGGRLVWLVDQAASAALSGRAARGQTSPSSERHG
jgi:6-phosphogluconolactonase